MRDDGERVRASMFPVLSAGLERNGRSEWYHRSVGKVFILILLLLAVLFVVAAMMSVSESSPDEGSGQSAAAPEHRQLVAAE